jgi:uncharacterized protein
VTTAASLDELEAAVAATASSIDGRRFVFQCPVQGLELQPGGYAVFGGRLGQVQELELASSDDVELTIADGRPPGRISFARGPGVVLDHDARPFSPGADGVGPRGRRRGLARAGSPAAGRARRRRARAPTRGLRFLLDAGGFDRHTFFCGQSGSGKTYALGTVLEQLLLRTSLRIVVLDPNSDFVRLDAVRDGVEEQAAAEYCHAAAGLEVRSGDSRQRLHVRFVDCDPEEQAAVLQLDPIRDVDEYGALVDMLDAGVETSAGSTQELAKNLLEAPRPELRALGARLRNLGAHKWPIWSTTGDEGSVQDLVATGGPRAVVVNLGSLQTPGEKAIAGESVLAALWRRRADRDPTLIVIDEAHNVCPREPADDVTALATEHAAWIAAEGRKFGLYFLVAMQRPQRVNELVLSQCATTSC